MGRPRIAEEDYLINEDLLSGELTGEWVRTALYSQGHRVSANGKDSYCGLTLVYDEQWWEDVQAWAIRTSHYEHRPKGVDKWKFSPTPYYLARDRRKNPGCSICKKGIDLMERENTSLKRETSQPSEVSQISEDYRPFEDPTPAERLQAQRFLTRATNIARLLDAELLPSN